MIDLFTFTYNINVTMNAMFCFLFITIQWLASMPLVGFENHNKSLVRHFLSPSLAPTRDSYGSQCPLKSSCLISFTSITISFTFVANRVCIFLRIEFRKNIACVYQLLHFIEYLSLFIQAVLYSVLIHYLSYVTFQFDIV